MKPHFLTTLSKNCLGEKKSKETKTIVVHIIITHNIIIINKINISREKVAHT